MTKLQGIPVNRRRFIWLLYDSSKVGNTNTGKKSRGSQSTLLEVTKMSVEQILNQLKEMVTAIKETELNVLDVQFELYVK